MSNTSESEDLPKDGPKTKKSQELKESKKLSEDKEEPINKRLQYLEVEGDLFLCPDTSSMAHCVSKDLHMSKGIATFFKSNFGRVNELRNQAKNVGECAVLQFPNRYIYYLITKKVYHHKPTYADLEASLVQMKDHCQANGVKELSMPQIACGLDRLAWSRVSDMIKNIFSDVDIKITVYIFVKNKR